MPDPDARKGLLDDMEELERRRTERKKEKKPPKKKGEGLDLDKVW